MAVYIKELGVLSKARQKTLETAVRTLAPLESLEASPIYKPADDERVVDADKRQSRYKALTDPGVFKAAEAIVAVLNKKDPEFYYQLVRNDITYIRYEPGGYFLPHEDYLSLTSNIIQEFTLLICIGGGEGVGGETIFTINPYFKFTSRESVTPGHCLLFRKDIVHEGAPLREGTKEIITLNLWGIPPDGDRYMKVCFTTAPAMSFDIPLDNIKRFNNVLYAAADFSDKKNPNLRIITYTETHYSPEEFKWVYDALMGCHVSVSETDVHHLMEVMDYYSIDVKNVLLMIEPSPKNGATSSIAFPLNLTDEIALCKTKSEWKTCVGIVKSERLPYIPFSAIVVEGCLTQDGKLFKNYEMEPIWLAVGEKNNVMFIHPPTGSCTECKLVQDKPSDDALCNKSELVAIRVASKVRFDKYSDDDNGGHDDPGDILIINANEGASMCYKFDFDLELMLPGIKNKKVIDYLFSCYDGLYEADNETILKETFTVPHSSENSTEFYSIDAESGELYIGPEQRESVAVRFKSANLQKLIKDKMNSTGFVLPQKKRKTEEFFCNESTYGNFTFMLVNGLLRGAS